MKYFLNYLFIFSIFFLIQCSKSPTKPKEPLISIRDVWFSETVDNDNDGYSSYAKFNFDLDVNQGSSEVFVKLGIRVTDTETYYVYFESVDFTIEGSTSEDVLYINIGAPNTELSQGSYDFLLHVFLSSDPNTVVAEASPSSDTDLYNVPFETSSEDPLTTWISYTDDTFEDGITGFVLNLLTVRFDQPLSAMSCIIKEIKVYIYSSLDPPSTSLWLQVGSDKNGYPDQRIYYSDAYQNIGIGWRSFPVNIDVSAYNPFYVGISHNQSDNLYLGVDLTEPYDGRSYLLCPGNTWLIEYDCDYAIEILVEYTVNDGCNTTKTTQEWLTKR